MLGKTADLFCHQLSPLQGITSHVSCPLNGLQLGYMLKSTFSLHLTARINALQLAAQAFSTATVLTAITYACNLTPPGRIASKIAFTFTRIDAPKQCQFIRQTFDASC